MLLLPAKSTISPTYMSFNNLFAASTFSLCESPHGIILEYLINTSQVNVLLVFSQPCFVKSPIGRLRGGGGGLLLLKLSKVVRLENLETSMPYSRLHLKFTRNLVRTLGF